MQEAERRRLDRPALVQRQALDAVGQRGLDHFSDRMLAAPVENEAEGAFGIVLTNQHHRSLEKRPA
jgi:hypothetical protein